MNRVLGYFFSVLLLTSFPLNTVSAAGVFSFTGGVVGSGAISDTYTIGYGFNVNSAVSVTEIGWYDVGGDGLGAAHDVGIWDGIGNLLFSTTVPSGSGTTLDDGFRYTSGSLLLPFLLNPGDYVIGGTGATIMDGYVARATVTDNDGRITYTTARLNEGSALAFPDKVNSVDAGGYFGPNMKVDPVPIPPAIWLFVSGLLGIIGIARGKKAKS